MGLVESVKAIGKYPELPCGESAMMPQRASALSDHVGGMLWMKWFIMAFLTSKMLLGMVPFICLFFAPFSPVVCAASRGLLMGSGRFFVCLFPLFAAFNGMPERPRDAVAASWNALWSMRVWSRAGPPPGTQKGTKSTRLSGHPMGSCRAELPFLDGPSPSALRASICAFFARAVSVSFHFRCPIHNKRVSTGPVCSCPRGLLCCSAPRCSSSETPPRAERSLAAKLGEVRAGATTKAWASTPAVTSAWR